MKRILLITFCLMLSLVAMHAQTLDTLNTKAFEAYSSQHYEEAVALYEQLTEKAPSADTYYNLGCAYYRSEDLGHAILWFERALKLDPSNEDVRYNLEYARSKTQDKISKQHEMFLTAFYHSLVRMFTVSQWAYTALAFFVLFLLCIVGYMLAPSVLARKIGFGLGVVSLVFTLLCNLFAYQNNHINDDTNSAVILVQEVSVKSISSDSGNVVCVLHEGTVVTIEDDAMQEWCEISLPNGKRGWIKKGQLERI